MCFWKSCPVGDVYEEQPIKILVICLILLLHLEVELSEGLINRDSP